jgi:hypothetical protein
MNDLNFQNIDQSYCHTLKNPSDVILFEGWTVIVSVLFLFSSILLKAQRQKILNDAFKINILYVCNILSHIYCFFSLTL